jgi:hypothetical protein
MDRGHPFRRSHLSFYYLTHNPYQHLLVLLFSSLDLLCCAMLSLQACIFICVLPLLLCQFHATSIGHRVNSLTR